MNQTRVYYQWVRLEALDQWWHWLALAMFVSAILSYVVFWYRRDTIELPKPLGWSLLLLRLTAFAGLLIFFFDLQKRSEQQIVVPSKVAVLVDTSLSMSLPVSKDSPQTRIEQVSEFLHSSEVLARLRKDHDVSILRFDSKQYPVLVASIAKSAVASSNNLGQGDSASRLLWPWISRLVWLGTISVLMSCLAISIGLGLRIISNSKVVAPYIILAGVVSAIFGLICIGTAALRGSDFALSRLWSFSYPEQVTQTIDPSPNSSTSIATDNAENPNGETSQNGNVQPVADPKLLDWPSLLRPSGTETRFGDAVASTLDSEQNASLAGIVLITDGQNNAGQDPIAAATIAGANAVPVVTIGIGSPDDPTNVRIVDVEAPKRVFPGDRFRIQSLIQSSGLAGKSCVLQLRRRSINPEGLVKGIDANPSGGNNDPVQPNIRNDLKDQLVIEEEKKIQLLNNDSLQPVTFDVKPREIGGWTYEVRVVPPAEDTNAQDNSLETEVRVVQPKSTILIIAGGPTREYQFVRNLLFRDETVQSHVFLQTGGPGISQEADKLLLEFPTTQAEWSQYDGVIAFDADWMNLSVEQIESMERWVSQQAGGLVLVAGPVSSPRWTGSSGNGDRRAEILRNLSPVVLNSRGTRLVSMGRFESETLWPLKLTDDAQSTDFLQVAGNSDLSRETWDAFSGVYSFFATYDPKPGATPLAYFSDPGTSMEGKLPIYLSTQFYGGGRVVFQGSGEIWRLRQLNDEYFDTYYTKLVRWVSQGRLLRDSDKGMLLLDKQQATVGEQIAVRAILKDDQFQPLILKKAAAKVIEPNGRSLALDLLPVADPSQLGVYTGQFIAKQSGNYEVQLPIGSLNDRKILVQSLAARVPTREIQRPQRNDILLKDFAERSGGSFEVDLLKAPIAISQLPVREQVNFLPGAPDRDFQLRVMGWLMALIATSLSLEWLLRRLSKLA